jgi:hypothetical protein
MTATAGSCEYGTESVGLVTKGCNWLTEEILNAHGRSCV